MLWKVTPGGAVKHLAREDEPTIALCGTKNLKINNLRAELLRACKFCTAIEEYM